MRTYTRTSNWCRAMFPRFFPCVIFPIPTPHHPRPKWTLLFLSHSYQYDCSHNLLYIIESNVQASNSLTQLNPPTAPLFSRCMHISPLRSPPVQKLKHPDMILFPTFGTNYFVLTSPNRASLHLRKQPVKRAPMKKTQRSRVHQWPTWQRELMNSLGFFGKFFQCGDWTDLRKVHLS